MEIIFSPKILQSVNSYCCKNLDNTENYKEKLMTLKKLITLISLPTDDHCQHLTSSIFKYM